MKVIPAALVGSIVLFVLGFVMYVLMDYHWKVIHPMPGGAGTISAMESLISKSGVYLIPPPPHDPSGAAPTEAEVDAWMAAHRAGPLGMIFWRTQGAEPMAPKVLLRGFAIGFIASLCAAMIARFAAVAGAGFSRRWAAIMVMALFAAAAVNMTNWNYWFQPDGYALVMVLDLLVAWAIVAIPIAAMVGGRRAA